MESKKISQKIEEFKAANPGRAFFSVEFFPPKTEDGVKNLESRFERFKKIGEHSSWTRAHIYALLPLDPFRTASS